MADRYWEAGEPPEALLDWVSENVSEAIKQTWEDQNPVAWIGADGGDVTITIAGPEKPCEPEDPTDIYTLKFDLLDEIKYYAKPYDDEGPVSDSQREDMRERARVLSKLADEISIMAAEAAEAGRCGQG